jgi:hypothetical protein
MKKLIISALLIGSIFSANALNVCKGATAKGTPCKSTIVGKNGYCNAHNVDAQTCTFIKKNGERCKVHVKQGQTLCHFHNK